MAAQTDSGADAAIKEDERSAPTRRLVSVDALRGFDMFWIMGAGSLVGALGKMSDNAVGSFLATQLTHADWEGLRFYDLIFPLFLFIVGVSLVFSLSKEVGRDGRSAALKRLFQRSAALFLIGIFYSGGLKNEWPDIRLLGVLQRLALGYFFGGLLFLFLREFRKLVWTGVGLLLLYWGLLTFVPIRNIQLEDRALETYSERRIGTVSDWFVRETDMVTGKYDKGLNLSNHLDFQYLPGKKWDKYWDPEGLLSTIPAIATCILGILAGLILRDETGDDLSKVRRLLLWGAGSLAFGYLWGLQFPIIKKVWTSSFVLAAGGWSFLLLAAFHFVIEVKGHQRWCRPFVWVGMNSITIYVTNNLIGYPGFQKIAERFVGGDVKNFFNGSAASGLGDLLVALVGLALSVLFCWYLHRKRIFLRL